MLKSDVRGGTLSIVKGSRSTFTATASRPLSFASVDGQPAKFKDAAITTGEFGIDESRPIEFQWRDEFELAGKNPFNLNVNVHDDEAPTLAVENLPRQKVVLDSEQLVFQVKAHDDYGVKTVGMEWRSKDKRRVEHPAKGEMPLGLGGHDQTLLELTGTFTANKLNIEPQAIELRVYAEDFFPERKRVYSAPYTFWVLNAEQHAIWVTEQLSRWHRQALEVRDREMQLYETNKQLRELSGEELDQPENRKRIENQAAAEKGNSRRLTNLTASGQNLLREAARNPEISANNLEAWAQMLGILKDIAGNRMPSVADLLKQASAAPSASTPSQAKKTGGPMVGQNRAAGGSPGKKAETDPNAPPAPVAPALVDSESSQQPPFPTKPEDGTTKKKPSGNSLRFPVTTLMGKPSDKKTDDNNTPAEDKVDQAIKEQKDLLAEFQKIADELNQLLANLEGSTLVKRLKAASRTEYKLSSEISKQLDEAFGLDVARLAGEKRKTFDDVGQQQLKGSQTVSYIMDDMQAFFERRQMTSLKNILDDMRTQDVIGSLRKLSDEMAKDRGLSVSQCEYWSDTLDRWAEDLVEAGGACECKGGSKASLPPAIVLEVLKILEGEINLREDTRVAEQSKPAQEPEKWHAGADDLSGTQKKLDERVKKVNEQIRDLPDAEKEFGKEMALLAAVDKVMDECTGILARPETGSPAIAAETEAIELLLKSKRINPKGGGGGGATPGGGGGGDTKDSALALLGSGVNEKEVREDHGISQATGQSGPVLPEEFRAGLDGILQPFGRRQIK